jgi:Holliday junction resolvase-like predicted endonuclease
MKVTKSTGELEKFSKTKLCKSLEDAGAPDDLITSACDTVAEDLHSGVHTSEIYRKAYSYLVKQNRAVAARYSIKQGIAALGPAGFLFEQYIELLLQAIGYKTRRNIHMRGACLSHEIDVLAKNDKEHVLVEAKYRNDMSIKTHVDVVMYAEARRQDITERAERSEGKSVEHKMWVITNTKFTSSAKKYAKCKGMYATGWSHPQGDSLENLVARHVLYPVTVLPSVDKSTREKLAEHDIMLVQDLASHKVTELTKQLSIPETRAKRIVGEAHELVYG